ncbi:hypothetical protein XH98_06825 [Bradyrhizobium sp. CCBAU 51745]|nr:hypothetical protein [Bradyrhizobium sp. CCBAU 45384]MDA9438836.1 hypothetical protein [Bradyrhizobium sp. CCBAU 51745]
MMQTFDDSARAGQPFGRSSGQGNARGYAPVEALIRGRCVAGRGWLVALPDHLSELRFEGLALRGTEQAVARRAVPQ